MATKNTPGKFDCYANAKPDEPMFVLLGRDPYAGMLVQQWADLREACGELPEKVAEARACVGALDQWARDLGKEPITRSYSSAWAKTLREEIELAINKYSAENGSNTPDFILAEYLTDSLAAFDKATKAREKWYGRESKGPGVVNVEVVGPTPPNTSLGTFDDESSLGAFSKDR